MADEMKLMEKWSLAVNEVSLGAGLIDGGTRGITIKIGGMSSLPFLFNEGAIPHRPVIAAEVCDVPDEDSPRDLRESYSQILNKPLDWAHKMIDEVGADLVCLKLQGIHPDLGDKTAKDACSLVGALLKEIETPLIVLGSGHTDKDNEVLPAVSLLAKGEKLLFGDVVQDHYKTLAAACIADGHNIIAESPIDVNIAKQLNILLSDLGMPLNRIVMNPTIGALGYGLEYAYSIMERARNAALSGDIMLAMPFICFVGQEAWRAREAKVSFEEFPQGGDARQRGIMWEVITAVAMLHAGADILTMQHPEAIKIVRKTIEDLMRH